MERRVYFIAGDLLACMTVGVETDNERIVWFWVGSFENFERSIKL